MILFLKITEMEDANARVNNLQNISVLLLKLFIARLGGGLAQWLGCRSLADGLFLICA